MAFAFALLDLAGAVALLLWGVHMVQTGVQRAFGARLRVALAAALSLVAAPVLAQEAPRWSLAIHGGAGVIERDSLSPEQDAAYRAALQKALDAGSAVLERGGSARRTAALACWALRRK